MIALVEKYKHDLEIFRNEKLFKEKLKREEASLDHILEVKY